VNFVSNSVPRTVRNYDSCCITSGKVVSISDRSVVIRRSAIGYGGGQFALVDKISRARLAPDYVPLAGGLRPGDTVSVHWGVVIEKLGRENERLLKRYTLKNLRAINKSAICGGRQ